MAMLMLTLGQNIAGAMLKNMYVHINCKQVHGVENPFLAGTFWQKHPSDTLLCHPLLPQTREQHSQNSLNLGPCCNVSRSGTSQNDAPAMQTHTDTLSEAQ